MIAIERDMNCYQPVCDANTVKLAFKRSSAMERPNVYLGFSQCNEPFRTDCADCVKSVHVSRKHMLGWEEKLRVQPEPCDRGLGSMDDMDLEYYGEY